MSVKLTAKLLKMIKAKQSADSVDSENEWIVAEMERLNGIELAVRQLNAKIETENKRHKDALAAIEHEKQKVFKSCDHLDSTYHGDPAGGSDSFTRCNICGYMDVKKEYRRS